MMSLYSTIRKALLNEAEEPSSGGEAFDKFDELYLKNHRDSISKLQAGEDKSSLGQDPDKAEEIYQFWDMHRKQIADRLQEQIDEAYGTWISPSGKLIEVIKTMGHEDKADEILIQSDGEYEGEASSILGKRGWARGVIANGELILDVDKVVTGAQRKAAKDYAIEHELEVMVDTPSGLRAI